MTNRIAEVFDQAFEHWDIKLPMDALEHHQRGEVQAGGWTIRFLFGGDADGEFMDYYATHRMTNDRHVRIFASGTVVNLEAPQDFTIFPADCTKEEEKEIEKKYYEENRRIYAELARKGFA